MAAVDFGTARIGIAICDADRILASPLEVHPAGQGDQDADYFRNLAARELLRGFVVGLPLHCDGGESASSLACRRFASWLATHTALPVRLFDERFTTADATGRIAQAGYSRKQKKRRVDAIAAQVILESFLEACRYRGVVAGEPAQADPDAGKPL